MDYLRQLGGLPRRLGLRDPARHRRYHIFSDSDAGFSSDDLRTQSAAPKSALNS